MTAPREVLDLVERFERNRDAYTSGAYNEAQLRREFLDPLFRALGWDVDNSQGHAEAYKEVIHEDSIRIAGEDGGPRAPDYCFRVGGTRKFFVEAKKPAVNVREQIEPAYQLRRYAWSAKLPLSILTDFEELAVYDCRVKPTKTDKATVARVMYFTYRDYAEKWDEIAGIFSKDAILKGSFDKYADDTKRKRGTAEVDSAFLKEIEGWREALAQNIALRNKALSQRDLNHAVQSTIDRIVFLRICEDRDIEDYGRLMGETNGTGIYGRLFELFKEADAKYNSGLFHFQAEKDQAEEPDRIAAGLVLDDKVLRDIIRGLYYPDCPYEFSVLGADILGQVYEQFLGKVIRLTEGHRAVIEEKPEVRKAGGVYYTPTYIVDYIVEHTVGKILEGKSPKKAAKLRILDPACGSGSFLIGAYQYLLDWHLKWYLEDGADKHNGKELYQRREDDWRLTTGERKRILVNNIYGVDIDPQAAEVTKLSLLLKVLEGETEQSLNTQMRLYHERALPDLGRNIKCGNSLIGPDFYEGQQMTLLDEEEIYRVNAFDWDVEFAEIMKAGGFDVVVGNPPYVRIQRMVDHAADDVAYHKRTFAAATKGSYDLYALFVERGLGLLAAGGLLGFIVPHKFFNSRYGQPLRELIAGGRHLAGVVHFRDQQVFRGASTYTCLLFLGRHERAAFQFEEVADLPGWRRGVTGHSGDIDAVAATRSSWEFHVGAGSGLLERLGSLPVTLGDAASRIFQGPITGADDLFIFRQSRLLGPGTTEGYSEREQAWIPIENALLKPVVRSGSVGRYWAQASACALYPYDVRGTTARLWSPDELADSFPGAWAYLQRNRPALEAREKGAFRDSSWYRYARTQNLGMWEQPKLLLPYMVSRLAAAMDREEHLYFVNVTTGGYGVTLNGSIESLEILCGLINSSLLAWYLTRVSTTFRGGYFAANKQYVERLPLPLPSVHENLDPSGDLADLGRMAAQLAELERRARRATAHDARPLQRRIAALDAEADSLVFRAYGLDAAEVAIVLQELGGEVRPGEA